MRPAPSLVAGLVAGLVCLAHADSAGQATPSKLPASKVAATDEPEPPGSCEDEPPPPPLVSIKGEPVEPPVEASPVVDARKMHLRPLHDELQLTYVHNLVAAEEIDALVRLASSRGGWARSPLKSQQSGERLEKDERRNSSSCPMLWPLVYAGREDEIRTSGGERAAALLEELTLVANLSARVAALFSATGMELTADYIEPLQLVRYLPSETFRPHHDYHEPDASGALGSAVQGEQRAFTVLLFGSSLPGGAGGETHFPHLEVAVTPRKGDAIVWANVDETGAPNPRSLHEGRPPVDGEKARLPSQPTLTLNTHAAR